MRRERRAEDAALAVAVAGVVFMLLAALGWAASAAPAAPAVPFGAESQEKATLPAPRKEVPVEPTPAPVAKSLLRGAKRAVQVADALLGPDAPGGDGAQAADLAMVALAAALERAAA